MFFVFTSIDMILGEKLITDERRSTSFIILKYNYFVSYEINTAIYKD